jgi:hypothetical protein
MCDILKVKTEDKYMKQLQPLYNENCYAMTFGGDYGYNDGAESMILSAHAKSIILSAGLLLPPLPLCCHHCCLCLHKGSSGGSTGVAICRHRGGKVATTVVDLAVFFCFFFVFCFFCFFLLHADEVMVSYLFPAADIGMMALSVAAAVVLGAIVP